MHRFLHTFTRGIAMLLVAVMVVIPVADALSCSFELDMQHLDGTSASEHALPAGDADGADPDERLHGVCAHNHCHHATAHLASGVALVHDAFERGRVLSREDRALSQDVPDGLLRPPRA